MSTHGLKICLQASLIGLNNFLKRKGIQVKRNMLGHPEGVEEASLGEYMIKKNVIYYEIVK